MTSGRHPHGEDQALFPPRVIRCAPMILWRSATPGEQAEQVKARLADWLVPRGLAFNEDKTRVVHLGEGFDFLGFTVRRFPSRKGGRLIIKPSAAAVGQFQAQAATDSGRCAARTPQRSWPGSPRSPGAGGLLPDSGVVQGVQRPRTTSCGSCATSGPRGPTRTSRSPGPSASSSAGSTPGRADRWVFGDRASGAYLPRLAWIKIERHQMVAGTASPMTRPWPRLGSPAPPGRAPDRRRHAAAASGAGAARCAGTTSCTPMTSHAIPENGNAGSPPPAGRSRARSWPPSGAGAHHTISAAWYTHTAGAAPPAPAPATELLHL